MDNNDNVSPKVRFACLLCSNIYDDYRECCKHVADSHTSLVVSIFIRPTYQVGEKLARVQ